MAARRRSAASTRVRAPGGSSRRPRTRAICRSLSRRPRSSSIGTFLEELLNRHSEASDSPKPGGTSTPAPTRMVPASSGSGQGGSIGVIPAEILAPRSPPRRILIWGRTIRNGLALPSGWSTRSHGPVLNTQPPPASREVIAHSPARSLVLTGAEAASMSATMCKSCSRWRSHWGEKAPSPVVTPGLAIPTVMARTCTLVFANARLRSPASLCSSPTK